MTPLNTFILQGTLTYPLAIERKNYVRFTVSLKITLFSFERCLPTDKKTKIREEMETIANVKNLRFTSMTDIHMSCVLWLGDTMYD